MDGEEEEDLVFDQSTLLKRKTKLRDGTWCFKFFKTMSLSVSFLALGLCIAIPGPTLLDLQRRVNTDTLHITYIFSARSVGYLLGAVIGGFLFDRFNPKVLLGMTLFVMTVATAAVPWPRVLTLLAVAFSFQGVAMGVLDTGGNVYCLQIWGKNSGPYLQLMHCFFGVGAFLSPFVAKPFLSADIPSNMTNISHNSGVLIPDSHVPIVIPDFNMIQSNLASSLIRVRPLSVRKRDAVGASTPTQKPVALRPVALKPVKSSGVFLKPDMADGKKMGEEIEKSEEKKTVLAKLTTESMSLNESLDSSNETNANVSDNTGNLTESVVSPTSVSPTTHPRSTSIRPTEPTLAITSPGQSSGGAVSIPASTNGSTLPMINVTVAQETTTVHHWKPTRTVDVFSDVLSAITNMSRICFAYLIIAIVSLIASVLFFSIYCCDKHISSLRATHALRHPRIVESRCFRAQLLILLFIFFFIYVGMEVTYGGFILTFTVEYLDWSKQDGVIVTAIYWGSIAFGRLLSIPISRFCKPTHMLMIDLVVVLLASLVLSFAVRRYHEIIWLGTLVLGLGMSSIFPTGVHWAEMYMKVTGTATTVMVVSTALGEMALPVATGYFFATMDKMALMYMMLALSVVSVIIYIVLQNLASNRGVRYDAFTRLDDAEMVDMVNYDNNDDDYVVFSQGSASPRKRQTENGYHKLAVSEDE